MKYWRLAFLCLSTYNVGFAYSSPERYTATLSSREYFSVCYYDITTTPGVEVIAVLSETRSIVFKASSSKAKKVAELACVATVIKSPAD